VIEKVIDGKKCEPFENVDITVPNEYSSSVVDLLNRRKGEMTSMGPSESSDAMTQLTFLVPTRGMIGIRSALLTATKGTAVLDTVFDSYRPETPPYKPLSDARHPESHIAHHNHIDIINAPYLLQIANDPLILDIAASFLGCKPTIGYMAVWWSYPTIKRAQQAEKFHRDVDDWRFLKLFIYLTDVNDKNGPHIYVTHSSTSNQLNEIRRLMI